MRFERNDSGSVLTVLPDGPLDDEGAPELIPLIERALQATRALFLVDLSKVTHITSVGLEVLLNVARKVTDVSGRIVFVGANEDVEAVLRMTRVVQRIEVLGTREEGMAILGNMN